jgi:hypothetical protein
LPWAQAIEATIVVDTDILAGNVQAIGLSGSDGKYRVPLNARVKFFGPLKLGVEDEAKAQMVDRRAPVPTAAPRGSPRTRGWLPPAGPAP